MNDMTTEPEATRGSKSSVWRATRNTNGHDAYVDLGNNLRYDSPLLLCIQRL